jgi:hypothetical protein
MAEIEFFESIKKSSLNGDKDREIIVNFILILI